MAVKPGLSALLGLRRGEALAIVGCGGKTSLVGLLARENRHLKVLILPTARILPMRADEAIICTTLDACLAHRPQPGVQCLAVTDAATGKLGSPPPELLPRLAEGYDLVLMEADGSRMLPCKGWREGEPVVPSFTTRTIGVITTAALGLPADENTVLRLPEFSALTGLQPGEAITLAALADMAGAPGGMFEKAVGEKILLINKVDSPGQPCEDALRLASIFRRRWPSAADEIIYGSIHQNAWRTAP
ncbi:MAG: selenium cofactor biosynthesis protein YqeC [Oscillospiraceae bacterium]|jgi:probable selenium-dependent hydroxylase accessory protein YqeC